MMNRTNLILSTSPQTQPARKLRRLANLTLRQRISYRGAQRNNTGKELDSETGLYYYGARYLDPKTSRWMSGDPALGEYVPSAPVSDEARKRNGNLPGMGGVFNHVNLHTYHYAGNNPVRYIDPDGRQTFVARTWFGGVNQLHFGRTFADQLSRNKTPSNASQSNETGTGRIGVDFGGLATQEGLRDISGYDRGRSEEACFALTLMSAVQDFTGVSLNSEQVIGLMEDFYIDGLINGENEVTNPSGILNATLGAVGRPDLVGSFSRESTQGDYMALRGWTKGEPSVRHFNLGDGDGGFMFDPWSGNGNPQNKPGTNAINGYITFRKREESGQND